ncbi:hypothetical protein [Thermofilum pendens]|uniref:DUF1640 domain-containing protein n=1 Tax=Thermofilum pendens (strain DSM 2475 / Hrk 5) TaxID=368408 RepID=A1S0D4_THEPD|nr:hypothetical protein Tpen_1517 [Thermofilum pendens Hrk 5]
MSLSIAEKLLEELRQREDLRRGLAEELVSEIFGDRRLRIAVLTALYRDVATKQDLKELREGIRGDIVSRADTVEQKIGALEQRFNSLEQRINLLEQKIDLVERRVGSLEQRIARLEGMMGLFVKLFIAFNVPILVGVVGILLKMALFP